ncbi:MAG: sugar phosphate isomerase/epimerase [Flavobacteriaceae bacterium]|jgi:sugar phosphate isomerase/epimerase|tara:strand:- start:276 stop:1250 length:975 start_codon:yes stop_codon:yes gene_type:complete
MKQNKFLKSIGVLILIIISFSSVVACKNISENKVEAKAPFFKLSLAQWSFHRAFRSGDTSPYEFAKMAHELGFEGLEYVNALYTDVMESDDKPTAIENFVKKNNALASEYKMQNVLIMIDAEGDLSSSDEESRLTAIENHKLWIEAAHQMNCFSVRLNLYGEKDPKKWIENSIKSLSALSDYAAPLNINVIVENHGRITSNVPLLMQTINGAQKANCGTLPDFGNFCISEEGYGSVFDGSCTEIYDPYKGVTEMMTKAFGVSAKSNDFDADGNETTLDFMKLMTIVREAGYTGFVGVEYEGSRLSEKDGIIATKELLETIGAKL